MSAPVPDPAAISAATVRAADHRLRALRDDPSLSYGFWLLTRITTAARQPTFQVELERLGLQVTDSTSILAFISQVSDHLRTTLAAETESGPFSELVSLAARRALMESIGPHGKSMFDSALSDLRNALRAESTQAQFGLLSQRFFADLFSRTLSFFLDRESSSVLVAVPGVSAVADNRDLMAAIDLHARQTARIVREFAGGWYSKHNWLAKGQITIEDTDRFVAYALQKLRSELQREGA